MKYILLTALFGIIALRGAQQSDTSLPVQDPKSASTPFSIQFLMNQNPALPVHRQLDKQNNADIRVQPAYSYLPAHDHTSREIQVRPAIGKTCIPLLIQYKKTLLYYALRSPIKNNQPDLSDERIKQAHEVVTQLASQPTAALRNDYITKLKKLAAAQWFAAFYAAVFEEPSRKIKFHPHEPIIDRILGISADEAQVALVRCQAFSATAVYDALSYLEKRVNKNENTRDIRLMLDLFDITRDEASRNNSNLLISWRHKFATAMYMQNNDITDTDVKIGFRHKSQVRAYQIDSDRIYKAYDKRQHIIRHCIHSIAPERHPATNMAQCIEILTHFNPEQLQKLQVFINNMRTQNSGIPGIDGGVSLSAFTPLPGLAHHKRPSSHEHSSLDHLNKYHKKQA